MSTSLLKFHLASLLLVMQLLMLDLWFIVIDLKDAYFHVSIHHQYCKYLKFHNGREVYQYTVLPFGLASAFRMLMKCMAPVMHLHLQECTIFPYLDYWLPVAQLRESLLAFHCVVLKPCKKLGFLINWEKSRLVHSQRVQFIGAILDSVLARGFLPADRVEALTNMVGKCTNTHYQSFHVPFPALVFVPFHTPWHRLSISVP